MPLNTKEYFKSIYWPKTTVKKEKFIGGCIPHPTISISGKTYVDFL